MRFEPATGIYDKASLASWLNGQSLEVALIVAARATLRISPLVTRTAASPLTILGAAAVARIAGRHPSRTEELRGAASAIYHAARRNQSSWLAGVDGVAGKDAFAAAALSASVVVKRASLAASIAAIAVGCAARATSAVGNAAWLRTFKEALASPKAPDHPAAAEAYGKRAADAYMAAVNSSEELGFWDEVRADGAAAQEADSDWLADLPLWSAAKPDWARDFAQILTSDLPQGDEWRVWGEWYEQRVLGGSRADAYEFVFASVPPDVWDKRPAAANLWICEHLPEE